MELYVPNEELQELKELLTGENVGFEVTDEIFSLIVEGDKIGEVTKVKAQLLETDVPLLYDQGPAINLRAFRLPSGRKFVLTDVNGNFVRVVEPPAGWER
jgi:hypothetical protein